MQIVYRGNIRDGKSAEYVEWLRQNAKLMADNTPDGWTYLGTWITVQGLGDYDAEARFEIDDYGALGAGWGSETYQRLLRENMDFLEPSFKATLMKSPTDVQVLEP